MASDGDGGGESEGGGDESDGGESEGGGDESDGGPVLDLPGEAPACDCGPGTTCVITTTDTCSVGCAPLPESCGEAPSCDPVCNWDLCQRVECHGEISTDETLCQHDVDEPVTGWHCAHGFGPCTPWLEQHCPEGETCRASNFARGLEWWTTSICSVPGTAAVGEPCERVDGIYEGRDNCVDRAICWNVDPDTNVGTCIAQCEGVPYDPICAEGTRCVMADPAHAIFCLPPCDPLADPCAPGYACTLVADELACMPAASAPAGLAAPCAYPNDCGPGQACVAAEQVPGCAGERCCTQFCDLDTPACPPELPGCVPAQSDPAPGLGHVGVCTGT